MRQFAHRFLAAAAVSLALVAAAAAQPGGPTPCTISICPNGTGSGYYAATPTFDATGCPQGPLPPAAENGTMYASVTMQAGGTGGTVPAWFEFSIELYDYTNGVTIYSKGDYSLPGVPCGNNPCTNSYVAQLDWTSTGCPLAPGHRYETTGDFSTATTFNLWNSAIVTAP